MEYLEINFQLLNKIKNHPQFLENIFYILNKKENALLKKELINIAIENNLQDITKYIDEFLESLNQNDFINTILEIKERLNKRNIIYDTDAIVSKYLTKLNNKKVTYAAYREKLINLTELDIINDYIDFLDENELLKIMQTNIELIETIFIRIKNQELLKFIIKKIEEFELEDYRFYFNFGINFLTKLNEENQVIYLKN